MTTERQRQERTAAIYCDTVYRYHYVCEPDLIHATAAYTFSAIAASESGAHRVLQAELPGVQARFTDRTVVPWPSRDRRVWGGVPVLSLITEAVAHCTWCRSTFVSRIGSLVCGRCREDQAHNRQYAEGRA